jgi:predicted esterase
MKTLLFTVLIATSVTAQTTRQSPRKGTYDLSFDQRSPLSALEVQVQRYGVERTRAQIYETAKEKFFVVVPEEYDAMPGWGLMIWCNAGRDGGMPRQLQELLAKKKLIGGGAYDVGNDRGVAVRIGLALDAVYNVRRQYTVDEHRIYIAGVSGGGKVAEMAAMAFPDVFDGAICCAGANWYKDVPVPGKANTAWPATFRRPPLQQFADAREHVGFVLIAGENDPNRQPMKAMFDGGFTVEKFKHVEFYNVPELGHQPPGAQWFEKGIDFLDGVPKERVKKQASTRAATKPAGKPRPVAPPPGSSD